MKVKAKPLFEDFVRGKGLRLTGERLALMDGVKRQRGHFNVDQLVTRLRREGCRVSRDMIYRNIPLLLEAGILEQSFKTSRDTFYESVQHKKHHDHLICRRCSKVIEFQDDEIERAQKRISDQNGFQLDYHCHQLVGLCKKCQKKKS